VQEEERKRIARDLHDETAQALASLSVEVGEIAMTKDLTRKTVKRLGHLQKRIASVVEGVRILSHQLRPGLLDKFGLVPSLEMLINELDMRTTLNCYVETSGIERRLSPDTEMVLFRIVQEALRNIKKHGHATEAKVKLQFTKNSVKVCVSDNGLGFDVPRDFSGLVRYSKLGLIGMEERVHLVNGVLSITSKRGKGTNVTVKIPAC
jgi:signal transduction histidine kinase